MNLFGYKVSAGWHPSGDVIAALSIVWMVFGLMIWSAVCGHSIHAWSMWTTIWLIVVLFPFDMGGLWFATQGFVWLRKHPPLHIAKVVR